MLLVMCIISFFGTIFGAGIMGITELISDKGLDPRFAFLISLVGVGFLTNAVWNTFLCDDDGTLAPPYGIILWMQAVAVIVAAGSGGGIATFYYEIYHHDPSTTTKIILIVVVGSLCVYGVATIIGSFLGRKIHAKWKFRATSKQVIVE